MINIIYHSSDLDGLASAKIVQWFYQDKYPNDIINFYPMNYKQNLNIQQFLNSKVIIVDFSLSLEEMLWLNTNSDLTWIDHHHDIIEKINAVTRIKGLQDSTNSSSAAKLCYMYFFGMEVPRWVELVSNYDTNQMDKDEDTEIFQMGMRSIIRNRLDCHGWLFLRPKDYNDSNINDFLTTGRTIVDYQYPYDMSMEYRGWTVQINNQNIFVINSVRKPIASARNELLKKYSIILIFNYSGNKDHIEYTIMSSDKNFDCSKFAQQYNGGGHRAVAGFKYHELIF